MERPDERRLLSRRTLLVTSLAGTTGLAAGGLLSGDSATRRSATSFYGSRQGGIDSAPLPHLSFAGFDLVDRSREALVNVLQDWTRIAAQLSASSGEQVSFTFGFGPSLFEDPRFGLTDQRPAPLVALPAFAGEALDPKAGNGDLCVQACADTPTLAHYAVRHLVNSAREHAKLRWRQTGFRDAGRPSDPRGMLGFRDGTANLDVHDPAQTAQHLWVQDGPAWLHGGTYLVTRRIRLLLDTWDRTYAADQEAVIGRSAHTNQRIDAPPSAHTRLATAAANGGMRVLRRSFSYDAGVDPNGLLDSGLIFISFQRDPAQFVTIQRRLAAHDALNAFTQHLASGLFACPPGIDKGGWVGEQLLA